MPKKKTPEPRDPETLQEPPAPADEAEPQAVGHDAADITDASGAEENAEGGEVVAIIANGEVAEIAEIEPNQSDGPEETPQPADELDQEQADLLDVELAQVISTPAGMKAALEAILFISPEALTLRRLCNLLDTRDKNLVEAALRQLQNDMDTQRRGVRLDEGAEGWRMVTREMFGELILRLRGRKRRPPMSPAALETLAIIAYRPGIIRAEIEAIRGVESSGTLRNLLDMNLIEIAGRRDVLGRPPFYATTASFLEAFGLKTLDELPQISELKAEFIKSAKAAEEREIEETKARPHSPDPEQLAAAAAAAEAEAEAARQAEGGAAEPDSLAGDELADEATEEQAVDEEAIEEEEGQEVSDEEAEQVLDEEAADDDLADEESVEELEADEVDVEHEDDDAEEEDEDEDSEADDDSEDSDDDDEEDDDDGSDDDDDEDEDDSDEDDEDDDDDDDAR